MEDLHGAKLRIGSSKVDDEMFRRPYWRCKKEVAVHQSFVEVEVWPGC